MAKNKNNGKTKKEEKKKDSLLSSWAKRWIKAILMFLVAIIVVLSFPFLDKAGSAGRIFARVCDFLIGKALYALPLFLLAAGLIFLKSRKKGRNLAMLLAIIVSIVGVASILAARDLSLMQGGWIGYLLAKLFVGLFGILVGNIIFGAILLIGLFIFLQFIWQELPKEKKEEKPSFALNRQESENLKIRGVADEKPEKPQPVATKISLFKKSNESSFAKASEDEEKREKARSAKGSYILPPLDLLSKNESAPTSGNIKENSMIIKNTLENFGIPVEMSEVNI